jgi:hypothetical protein
MQVITIFKRIALPSPHPLDNAIQNANKASFIYLFFNFTVKTLLACKWRGCVLMRLCCGVL